MPETIEPDVVPSEASPGDKPQFALMFEYHRRQADDYAERSHETWKHSELADGYSALSEAHNQFAMICGKLAGIDLSQYEGEM